MLLTPRNPYSECAADTNGALHPHTAAVQFHQFLNECQSDSCAFVCPGASALDAMKAFEHPLAMLFGNSHARVADQQFDCAVHRFQRNRNLALERKLEGVG